MPSFAPPLPAEVAAAIAATFTNAMNDADLREFLRGALGAPTVSALAGDDMRTLLTRMERAGWIVRRATDLPSWERTPIGEKVLAGLDTIARSQAVIRAEIRYCLSEAGREAAPRDRHGFRVPRDRTVYGEITDADRDLFRFDGQGIGITEVSGELDEPQTFVQLLGRLRMRR